jgi:chromosome segregation ATPase
MDQVNLEKRQKRLIRNKESARKSRNRKKHYQEFLENKVKMLCQEASNLRNQIYKKSEDIEMSSQSEYDMKTRLDTVLEKLMSSCNQRKEHIKFIIEEVIDVMIPSHAKLLIMACEKPDIRVPELSDEQIRNIKELQPDIVREQMKLKEVVTELKNIKGELDSVLDWAGQLPQHLKSFLPPEKIGEILNAEPFN